MKEQDKFILDIKRLGINGEGIGFYKKLAVFVEDAIPGEGHNVCITKVLNHMAFAETFEIKHSSPDRIEPVCPHYKKCGGCNVSHIKYNKMLEFKRDSILESLKRYTNINPRSFEIKPTIRSAEIYNYRNRSLVSVVKGENCYKTCFVNPKTNDLVDIDECCLQHPIINELNKKIVKLAYDMNVSLYIHKFNRGILRYISIRLNEKNQAIVCLVCGEKNSKIRLLAKEIIKLDNVYAVYENFNTSRKENVHFTDDMNLLEGKDDLLFEVNNLKIKLDPTTYLPYNTNQIPELYENILKACKLSKKENVLVPHSKNGIIALYLSRLAKQVYGIEYNKNAIFLAEENLSINKINNVKFLQGDVKQLLAKVIKEKEIDVVVLEHSKTSIDEEIQILLESGVKKIILYGTANTSLAKNMNDLTKKYSINMIVPIDMAPQTISVDIISVCTKIVEKE